MKLNRSGGEGLKRIICKVIAMVTGLGMYGNVFPIRYQFINDDTNLGWGGGNQIVTQ